MSFWKGELHTTDQWAVRKRLTTRQGHSRRPGNMDAVARQTIDKGPNSTAPQPASIDWHASRDGGDLASTGTTLRRVSSSDPFDYPPGFSRPVCNANQPVGASDINVTGFYRARRGHLYAQITQIKHMLRLIFSGTLPARGRDDQLLFGSEPAIPVQRSSKAFGKLYTDSKTITISIPNRQSSSGFGTRVKQNGRVVTDSKGVTQAIAWDNGEVLHKETCLQMSSGSRTRTV